MITRTLAVLAALLAVGAVANGQFANSGFETGDLTGWNSAGNATVASGQSYGSSGTVLPDEGTYSAKLRTNGMSASDIAAFLGTTEAAIEAVNGSQNATNGSAIKQTVNLVADGTFQFRWNFVEQDYVPFDDFAFYTVDGTPYLFASLAAIGPGGGSTPTIAGWTTVNFSLSAGTHTIGFGIVNVADTALDSDLWLDGAGKVAGPVVPEPATIVALSLGLFGAIRRRRSV